MINEKQYLFLVLLVIVFIGLVVNMVRLRKFEIRYALLWLATSAILLIILIFPQIILSFSTFAGFELASNAVYLIAICFLTVITLALSMALSNSSKRIKILARELAIVKNEVNQLKHNLKIVNTNMKES